MSGTAILEGNKNLDITTRINALINSSPVFLFMKGNPDMPQCGFSANIVRILNDQKANFNSFNILSDMDIREGVKAFSNWPTYPQLYVKGELIGGNDIVTELANNGELQDILK